VAICRVDQGDSVPGPSPTLQETREKLLGLLSGRYSRDEVRDWAWPWVITDDPHVDDRVLWRVVTAMAAVDTPADPDGYLFWEPDFHAWLDELEQPHSDRP
jgi:hypothetical protein